MKPSDLSVLVSLLSYLPYSWDTLLGGRRLEGVRRSDEIASRAGMSVRSLAGCVRRLSEIGLVRARSRGRLATLWEVTPKAFGLVDDDDERRRGANLIRRNYVALPLAVVGQVAPAELAFLIHAIKRCGARPYSRIGSGERLVATFDNVDLCTAAGISSGTARRAFASLVSQGLLAGDVRRGRWIVEPSAEMFGGSADSAAAPDLPNKPSDRDKFAENAASLLHEHEETPDRRGARARAAALYPVLLTIAYGGRPAVTTPSMRGRVAQSALRLALAGSVESQVEREGWRLAREAASPPRPESIVDAVLALQARSRMRSSQESRFASSLPVTPRPALDDAVEPEQMADFDQMELSAMRWRAQLEAGDPAVESFRELLGSVLLPWQPGYVSRARRAGAR